jgi:hypothetical protein
VRYDELAIPDKQWITSSEAGDAAPKCSNHTDLQLTLSDLFHAFDLPERPSPTSTSLVCIQMLSIARPGQSNGEAAIRCRVDANLDQARRLGAAGQASTPGSVSGVEPAVT